MPRFLRDARRALVAALAVLAASSATAGPAAREREPIGTVREVYDGTLTPDLAVSTFRHIDWLLPSSRIAPSAHPRPLPLAARPLSGVRFHSRGRDWDLYDYLAVNRVAGLLVLKDGHIAAEIYQYGNTPETRWMSMSVAKSITSTLVGVAIHEGYIASLEDPVTRYARSLQGSAYEAVSIRDILMMASGVRWDETYTNPQSDRRHLLEAQISQTPGASLALMAKLPRAAAAGTVYNYNTGETMVAGEVVRRAAGRPLAEYLSEKIWKPFGMASEATWWLASGDGTTMAGSGFAATLRDYGRFGLYILGDGVIDGRATLPDGWLREATTPKTLKGGERQDYGYFWWPALATIDSPDPEGAFAAEGIFGQYVHINPRERLVIVEWSARSKPEGMDIVDDQDFFAAVARALH